MQGHWLLVLDHYLLIPLSHTFNQLREDMCQRVGSVIWIHKELCFLEVIQMPPCHVDLNEIANIPSGDIEYHAVVTESDRLPIWDWMTMTLYLKPDMVEEHWTMCLEQVGRLVTTSLIGNNSYYLEYRGDSKPND